MVSGTRYVVKADYRNILRTPKARIHNRADRANRSDIVETEEGSEVAVRCQKIADHRIPKLRRPRIRTDMNTQLRSHSKPDLFRKLLDTLPPRLRIERMRLSLHERNVAVPQ